MEPKRVVITWKVNGLAFHVGDRVRRTTKERDGYGWVEGVIEEIAIDPPDPFDSAIVWYRFRADRGPHEGVLGGFPAESLELVEPFQK